MPNSPGNAGPTLQGMWEKLRDVERDYKDVKKENADLKLLVRETEREQVRINSRLDLSDQRMTAIEKSLEKIDENTTYTRRQMTNIFVGAAVTAIIGGAVALIYGMIGGGVI